jgi:PKD repeat protein
LYLPKMLKGLIFLLFLLSLVLTGCQDTTPGIPTGTLEAQIITSTTSGEAPLEIALDASGSSSSADIKIISYSWDFGDGQMATGQSVQHGYQSPGNYTVSLNIADEEGLTATASVLITVFESSDTVVAHTFDAQEGTDFDSALGLKVLITPASTEEKMKLEVGYDASPAPLPGDFIHLHSRYAVSLTTPKEFLEEEKKSQDLATVKVSLVFDLPPGIDPQSVTIFEWTPTGWCLAGASDLTSVQQLGGVLTSDGSHIALEIADFYRYVAKLNALDSSRDILGSIKLSLGSFSRSLLDVVTLCPMESENSPEKKNGFLVKKVFFQSPECDFLGFGRGIYYQVGVSDDSVNLLGSTYSQPYVSDLNQIIAPNTWYLNPTDDPDKKGVLTLSFGAAGGTCTVWLEADLSMLIKDYLLFLIPYSSIAEPAWRGIFDVVEVSAHQLESRFSGEAIDWGLLSREIREMLSEITKAFIEEGLGDLNTYTWAFTTGVATGELFVKTGTYLQSACNPQNPCHYERPGHWEWQIIVPSMEDNLVQGGTAVPWTTNANSGISHLINIFWNIYEGADGYKVYRKVNNDDWQVVFQGEGEIPGESGEMTDKRQWHDEDVSPGNTYEYSVTACGIDWETAPNFETGSLSQFLPPIYLNCPVDQSTVTDSTLTLQWSPLGGIPNGFNGPGKTELRFYDADTHELISHIWFDDVSTSSYTFYHEILEPTYKSRGGILGWKVRNYAYDQNGEKVITQSEYWEFNTSPPAQYPIIDYFMVNPFTINEGDSAILSWSVIDASTVTINPGGLLVALSGSTSVFPTSTTTYTFEATNSDGSTTATATVTVIPSSGISASISSYSHSSKMTVNTGQTFTISTTFANTGNTAAYFYAGASVWNSSGNVVFDDWSGKMYLNPGEQKTASWTHTINTPGEYWLQFGVWDETKSQLLDKEPSPLQNLVSVILPSPTDLITNGSFSSGTSGWTLVGDFWAGTSLSNYCTSPGYAAGGVTIEGVPLNHSAGWMYQNISIPAESTSADLSFWYNITSEESSSTAYDVLNVTVKDSAGSYLATVAVFSNLHQSSVGHYKKTIFNMSPYIGQTVQIHFLATTDNDLNTVFRIDDVSLLSDG